MGRYRPIKIGQRKKQTLPRPLSIGSYGSLSFDDHPRREKGLAPHQRCCATAAGAFFFFAWSQGFRGGFHTFSWVSKDITLQATVGMTGLASCQAMIPTDFHNSLNPISTPIVCLPRFLLLGAQVTFMYTASVFCQPKHVISCVSNPSQDWQSTRHPWVVPPMPTDFIMFLIKWPLEGIADPFKHTQ